MVAALLRSNFWGHPPPLAFRIHCRYRSVHARTTELPPPRDYRRGPRLHSPAHRRAPAVEPTQFVGEAVHGVELGAAQRGAALDGVPRPDADAAPPRPD